MSKFWDWFDGSKLAIGNGLIAIAAHIPSEVIVPYFEIPINVIVYALGGIIASVGGAHKVKKRFTPSKLPS